MKRVFVETSTFTRAVDAEGREALLLIQGELLERLESSPVIPGTGGLRKLRMPDAAKGKGKRGGYRVIFLDIPGAERTYLLGLYGKGEKADIARRKENPERIGRTA